MFKKAIVWFLSLFAKEVKEPVVITKLPRPKRYISNHARKRFEQRHGVIFTDEQAKSIVEDIMSQKAQFLGSQPGQAEEWIAEYGNKKYRVIFSLQNKLIITVYSSIKEKKKRKPKGKKKRSRANGTHRSRHERRPKPSAYKRSTKVVYEESML